MRQDGRTWTFLQRAIVSGGGVRCFAEICVVVQRDAAGFTTDSIIDASVAAEDSNAAELTVVEQTNQHESRSELVPVSTEEQVDHVMLLHKVFSFSPWLIIVRMETGQSSRIQIFPQKTPCLSTRSRSPVRSTPR